MHKHVHVTVCFNNVSVALNGRQLKKKSRRGVSKTVESVLLNVLTAMFMIRNAFFFKYPWYSYTLNLDESF